MDKSLHDLLENYTQITRNLRRKSAGMSDTFANSCEVQPREIESLKNGAKIPQCKDPSVQKSENLQRFNKSWKTNYFWEKILWLILLSKWWITPFVVVILGLQLLNQVVGHNVGLVVLLLIVPEKLRNWEIEKLRRRKLNWYEQARETSPVYY